MLTISSRSPTRRLIRAPERSMRCAYASTCSRRFSPSPSLVMSAAKLTIAPSMFRRSWLTTPRNSSRAATEWSERARSWARSSSRLRRVRPPARRRARQRSVRSRPRRRPPALSGPSRPPELVSPHQAIPSGRDAGALVRLLASRGEHGVRPHRRAVSRTASAVSSTSMLGSSPAAASAFSRSGRRRLSSVCSRSGLGGEVFRWSGPRFLRAHAREVPGPPSRCAGPSTSRPDRTACAECPRLQAG